MRNVARFAIAAATVISAFAAAGIASAEKAKNCDGCLAGVAANGSLLGSRGVISSRRLTQGYYEVKFRRPIAGCAISATQVLLSTGDYPASYVSAEIPPGAAPNVLRFYVIALSGANDSAFTVTLICI